MRSRCLSAYVLIKTSPMSPSNWPIPGVFILTKEQHAYIMALPENALKALREVKHWRVDNTIAGLIALGISASDVTPELILAIEKAS